MVTNIIQIGNSKGIILPSEVLKQLRLSLKSAVCISLDGNNIVIPNYWKASCSAMKKAPSPEPDNAASAALSRRTAAPSF